MDSELPLMTKPPSQLIKDEFDALKGKAPSDAKLRMIASRCLLPTEEVRIWLNHLNEVQKNRRGAEKAAATRKLKKQQKEAQMMACGMQQGAQLGTVEEGTSDEAHCGVCGDMCVEITDEIEQWIACDSCGVWFHFSCVQINPAYVPDEFICSECL